MQPIITTVHIEHIVLPSQNPFEVVRSKLETLLPRVDQGIFALLSHGESDRALRELEKGPTLAIFGSRDHGAVLQIAGLERKAIQYDIGNALTASKMSRHNISASLYPPIRVLLRESESGEVAFEYDRPVSVFGQFKNAAIDEVAFQLDRDLQTVLQNAAT